jgi:hypothetical protein
MQPLVVFIGGGGCRSEWYGSSINSTHAEYQQIGADVPPYKILQVPKPKDLVMAGPGDGEFIRFAISYGLSIPFGEGPEIKLPSQFSVPPPSPPWSLPGWSTTATARTYTTSSDDAAVTGAAPVRAAPADLKPRRPYFSSEYRASAFLISIRAAIGSDMRHLAKAPSMAVTE